MSAGGDEVEAAMDAVVGSSRPLHPRFRVEIFFILVLDEVGDRLPTARQGGRKNSRKSVRWSAVPVPCLSRLWLKLRGEQGSSPEGVDDLCFHTYGEFSPPPPPPYVPPPLKS